MHWRTRVVSQITNEIGRLFSLTTDPNPQMGDDLLDVILAHDSVGHSPANIAR